MALAQILDVVGSPSEGGALGDAHAGTARFFADLPTCRRRAPPARWAHLRRARARLQPPPGLGRAGRSGCWSANDTDALEGIIPGLAGCSMDLLADGGHPDKEGPCASCQGISDFGPSA